MSALAPQTPLFGSNGTPQRSHVELMRSCLTSDSEQDWNEFVARYNRFICLAVLRAYGQRGRRRAGGVDVELIDDLVQEVYLKLFEGSRSVGRGFRGASDAAVFVYIGRVAISVVIDHFRRNGARKRGSDLCSLDDVVYGDEGQEVTVGDRIAAPGPSPEDAAVGALLREEIAVILGRVLRGRNATRDRRIADTFIFEGCSLGEIADRIGGIRESGVKSSIRRTSMRLRGELARLERASASRRMAASVGR
jgi:RNA polymerase sigma factor (sigma-70 family)